MPDPTHALVDLLRQIPSGRVATCGLLAHALGHPAAARWIGHFLLHHDHDPHCACHRVLRADGSLGGYVGGRLAEKRRRLLAEGVHVVGRKSAGGSGASPANRWQVHLPGPLFDQFVGERPLARLALEQSRLVHRLSDVPPRRWPDVVGGVDVAYPRPGLAVAAYALVRVADGELLWSTTYTGPVRFPYISGFLAYRELPLLTAVTEAARAAGRLAEVVLVDGSGRLHPRHLGLAAHYGLACGLATIGVAKKLLWGRVDESRPISPQCLAVVDAGRTIGGALRTTPAARRPLYVSPGQSMNVEWACRLVAAVTAGHRLPEPIYWADRLSRRG